nr:unnamed protein product [Callosobruchus analis]
MERGISSLSPHTRLSATIKFLATGRSYQSLKFPTITPTPSLNVIILKACKAIITIIVCD